MDNLALRGLNIALQFANFTALNTAVTTITTGNTIPFAINGKCYSKANGALTTPTTGAASGSAITLTANQGRAVVLGLDSGGNPKLYEGAVVAWDGSAFQVAPPIPNVPDSVCPIGLIILKAGSTLVGTFTVGSSNWNAMGMTATITSLVALPDRPQTA